MIASWYYDAVVIAFASFIIAASVWVLAKGAAAWADAQAAEHRARAHGIEADMQRDTIAQARDTATRVMAGGGGRPPTPEEIREAILAQRANGQVDGYQEFTTSGDVTPDELNEHMQGGEFKEPAL